MVNNQLGKRLGCPTYYTNFALFSIFIVRYIGVYIKWNILTKAGIGLQQDKYTGQIQYTHFFTNNHRLDTIINGLAEVREEFAKTKLIFDRRMYWKKNAQVLY